jgi:hypothetical protein
VPIRTHRHRLPSIIHKASIQPRCSSIECDKTAANQPNLFRRL